MVNWLMVSSEKYEFVRWDDDIPNIYGKKSHVPNHRPVANGDLPINWIIKMEHKTYSKMGPVSCLIPRNLRGPGGLPGNEASCRVNMNGDRALPVQVAFHHPDISRQHLTKNMCVGCLGHVCWSYLVHLKPVFGK